MNKLEELVADVLVQNSYTLSEEDIVTCPHAVRCLLLRKCMTSDPLPHLNHLFSILIMYWPSSSLSFSNLGIEYTYLGTVLDLIAERQVKHITYIDISEDFLERLPSFIKNPKLMHLALAPVDDPDQSAICVLTDLSNRDQLFEEYVQHFQNLANRSRRYYIELEIKTLVLDLGRLGLLDLFKENLKSLVLVGDGVSSTSDDLSKICQLNLLEYLRLFEIQDESMIKVLSNVRSSNIRVLKMSKNNTASPGSVIDVSAIVSLLTETETFAGLTELDFDFCATCKNYVDDLIHLLHHVRKSIVSVSWFVNMMISEEDDCDKLYNALQECVNLKQLTLFIWDEDYLEYCKTIMGRLNLDVLEIVSPETMIHYIVRTS